MRVGSHAELPSGNDRRRNELDGHRQHPGLQHRTNGPLHGGPKHLVLVHRRALYRTADGGRTWQKVYTGEVTASYFRAPNGTHYLAGSGVLQSTGRRVLGAAGGLAEMHGHRGELDDALLELRPLVCDEPPIFARLVRRAELPHDLEAAAGTAHAVRRQHQVRPGPSHSHSASFSGGFWRVRTE